MAVDPKASSRLVENRNEVNVYDTGSTDGTLELLDRLAAEPAEGHESSAITERRYIHLFEKQRTDEVVRQAIGSASC